MKVLSELAPVLRRPALRPPGVPIRHARAPFLPAIAADARHFQIAVLACLLAFGVWGRDFGILPLAAAAFFAGTLCAQALFSWAKSVPFDPRSALITALSLTLLLRVDAVWLALAAGFAAIASKFLIRIAGKHVFNPANFAIVAALLLAPLGAHGVWVSPGQWGSAPLLTLLFACLGVLVLTRARRADISLGFLAFFGGLLFARAAWLGDPLTIPLHQMQSGALLLFAFFMISDPRSTPDSRSGRLIFAAIVAVVAVILRFQFYIPEAIFYALALASPLTPLIDRILLGTRFTWDGASPAVPSAPHNRTTSLTPQP